jgi:hypothetical protein
MRYLFGCFLLLVCSQDFGQLTRFEISNGKETATYQETIAFYKQIDKSSSKILMKEVGATDAGYPLHIVLVSNDGKFNTANWHQQNKVVIMINNGIHPGEPDGIDATMILLRDIATGKYQLPDNVCLGSRNYRR